MALAVALAWGACGVSAAAEPSTQSAAPGPRWGHEIQQVAPDPAVRFGRLPNGLRYALQHNETPADGVAMRLRIGAGSLQERDGEEGLAHLLEHMAFRGSANLADGEVVRLLQRQGLAYGPDTNAGTYQHQTVYWFNFPRADAASLDAGLLVFREIGERLALDAQLVQKEKGVVLAEARLRDVPAHQAEMAELNNVWAGSRLSRRWPIGREASVRAATAEKLRRYYRANYRPDNATLVVVGRIDVDALERQIRERFVDWHSDGQADSLDMGTAQGAQPAVEFVSDGVGEVLSLTWPVPLAAGPAGLAPEREGLATQAALALLNEKLKARDACPAGPSVSCKAELHDGRARLLLSARPQRWRDVLDAALEELRRLLERGVQPADMWSAVWGAKFDLKTAAERMATRTSAAIADALVSAAASDGAYISPAQDWAAAEPVLESLRPDEVSAALRHRFAGTPLLFRSTPSEPAGVEALTRQLALAMSRPLPERAPRPAAPAPQPIDLGAPSDVVSRSVDADLGTTRVEFANGTRLMVKPTSFAKGKVSVQVLLGQGRSGVPKERCHAIWALDKASLGGTRLRQKLGYVGSLVSAPHTFVLSDESSSDTLPGLLKDMTHFIREAAFQGELADQLASAGPALLRQVEAQASTAFQREMERVMFGNGACLAGTPYATDVSATQLADLPAVLGPAFAGVADVVLVGDLTVKDAIAAVQASLGAGPVRPRLPHLPVRVQPLPEGEPAHVATHHGRADQALLGLFWPLPDFWANPALDPAGQVAAAVLRNRLIDSARETLGIVYSPLVNSGASTEVQGLGMFVVQLETPPDQFDTVRQLVQAQLRVLADAPVSAEELQSARQPVIEGWRGVQQQNAFWAGVLRSVLTDDRLKGAMLGIADHLQAITPAHIQAFFRDHIARRAPIEVQAVAATSQPASTPSAP